MIPFERIVLTGFMGAGKSTVGALLASRLGWRFVDSDDELVRTAGASIAELFERHGEAGFRILEEQTVVALMTTTRSVVALGGGALEFPATRERVFASPGTYVVYLDTPLAVALARCSRQSGGAVRPVLREQAAPAERFTRRLEHYRQAHHTLLTEDRTPAQLAALLLETLNALQAE